MKVIDSDANDKIYSSNNNDTSITNTSPNHNKSGYKTIKVNQKGKSGNIKDSKPRFKSPPNKRRIDKHKTRKLVVIEETDGEYVQISIPTKTRDRDL